MNRRVEFSLNLDNPSEAALYDALNNLLRHRRAGEVIRQALAAYLFAAQGNLPSAFLPRHMVDERSLQTSADSVDAQATSHIVEQSAAMFGF